MPEVINLLSSTPPPPANTHEPSSFRKFHSSPPASADLRVLSDDFDVPEFTNDAGDGFKPPPKRRRLTPEPVRTAGVPGLRDIDLRTPNTKTLFLFSDEIVPSSTGPKDASRPSAFVLDSDPIVFTSSAPEPTSKSPSPRKDKGYKPTTADEDILTGFRNNNRGNTFRDNSGALRGSGKRGPCWRENIEECSDPIRLPDPCELFDFQDENNFVGPGLGSEFSSRTANLLANLGDRSGTTVRTNSKPSQKHTIDLDEDDSDELPEPQSRKPKKATTTTKRSIVDKEAKAKEREATKAQRDREKQLEKERKLKAKEEKAKEKQLAADIAHVNKLKVDKKDSTPEMIVDLATSFQSTSVGNQAVEYMQRLGVEHTFFDSPITNIVKWRRKMKARFNDTLRHWEPCVPYIREEEHVLCLVTAQEFVNMVTSALGSDTPYAPSELEVHVLRIKSAHPNCVIIYLIEGLTAWMRKNANSRNRAYQAEFRRHLDEAQGSSTTSTASSSTSTRRKKANKPEVPPIDDDTVEDALLSLQVTHQCLIHHTVAAPESAEWIKNFTEHISTVPYRRQKLEGNDSAFCMDTGQVKPGENKSDTFVRMLQEVNRVTASMAYGIINQYPSVVKLVEGMRDSGPAMLEDVKKSANKNGAITDSRIGPAASRRLYKVFMGLDPNSTDI